MTTKADTTTNCRPCKGAGWHDCTACEHERGVAWRVPGPAIVIDDEALDGTCDLADACKFCDNTRRVHCENCNADGEREDADTSFEPIPDDVPPKPIPEDEVVDGAELSFCTWCCNLAGSLKEGATSSTLLERCNDEDGRGCPLWVKKGAQADD